MYINIYIYVCAYIYIYYNLISEEDNKKYADIRVVPAQVDGGSVKDGKPIGEAIFFDESAKLSFMSWPEVLV